MEAEQKTNSVTIGTFASVLEYTNINVLLNLLNFFIELYLLCNELAKVSKTVAQLKTETQYN